MFEGIVYLICIFSWLVLGYLIITLFNRPAELRLILARSILICCWALIYYGLWSGYSYYNQCESACEHEFDVINLMFLIIIIFINTFTISVNKKLTRKQSPIKENESL